MLFDGLLRFEGLRLRDGLDGAVVASVVPPVTDVVERLLQDHVDAPTVVVAPGIRTGIPLRYEDPREVGADRIANAVAAGALYGGPAIIVDFGTSTNVDVIDRSGAFLGGAIAPGVTVSAEALVRHAAQLPEVVLRRPPRAIGRTTVEALQSGIVHGAAAQVDGLVDRIAAELEPGPDAARAAADLGAQPTVTAARVGGGLGAHPDDRSPHGRSARGGRRLAPANATTHDASGDVPAGGT